MFADVIFNIPLNKKFTYRLPDKSVVPEKGDRVCAPFGRRKLFGIIIKVYKNIPENITEDKIKDVEYVFPTYFRLNSIQFEIARRIWLYYMCSYGQALNTVGGALKNVKAVKEKYKSAGENKILLNSSQNEAINTFFSTKKNNSLLLGVTGSGKTEVYFTIIEKMIEQGKQALYLLPEIALTPQVVKRFTDRFGESIAVYNSKVSNGKKNSVIERFRNGRLDVVVGTRSSVFIPAKDLGVIILDEEHEYTYKQQETPCYDARRVAIWRGEIENAKVLFGSATPSLESMKLAMDKEYELINMDKRADGRRMPEVHIVDMSISKRKSINISEMLYKMMCNTLEKNEQVILFLNRRGFASFVICKDCKEVIRCKNCDISLNYHKHNNKLICHYCDYKQDLNEVCPSCKSKNLELMGSGTQRIEDELAELFPGKNIVRVDRDTSSKKDFFWDFYSSMNEGKIDIVIGTQMIGKGFDFPKCSLVGVLWADFILDFPDFRSAERTNQLLTQVAGRSGRGVKGEVCIQTYSKEHYALEAASHHNYLMFYKEEIYRRKMLGFPPYMPLIRLIIKGRKKDNIWSVVDKLSAEFEKVIDFRYILGPAPAPIGFLKGVYRFNFMFRINGKRNVFYEKIKSVLDKFPKLEYKLDVDPVDML